VQYNRYISGILLIAALILSGCQPVERPFQPTTKASVRGAPGPRAALYVGPVEDGPVILDSMVIKELQKLGIAAFGGEKVPFRYSISSQINIKDGKSFVTWRVADPLDRPIGLEATVEIGALQNGPSINGPDLIDVTLKSASKIDVLLGGSGIDYTSRDKPVLFIPIVSGAPGNGSETLAAAMQDEVLKYGLDVSADQWEAAFILKGTVTLTQPKRGTQVVSILWQLERRNGEYVGKVEQRNRIRAGTLNGAWGPVAPAAAKGGARGILKLLKKVEPSYFRKK
jgi:hypothetical protein